MSRHCRRRPCRPVPNPSSDRSPWPRFRRSRRRSWRPSRALPSSTARCKRPRYNARGDKPCRSGRTFWKFPPRFSCLARCHPRSQRSVTGRSRHPQRRPPSWLRSHPCPRRCPGTAHRRRRSCTPSAPRCWSRRCCRDRRNWHRCSLGSGTGRCNLRAPMRIPMVAILRSRVPRRVPRRPPWAHWDRDGSHPYERI